MTYLYLANIPNRFPTLSHERSKNNTSSWFLFIQLTYAGKRDALYWAVWSAIGLRQFLDLMLCNSGLGIGKRTG